MRLAAVAAVGIAVLTATPALAHHQWRSGVTYFEPWHQKEVMYHKTSHRRGRAHKTRAHRRHHVRQYHKPVGHPAEASKPPPVRLQEITPQDILRAVKLPERVAGPVEEVITKVADAVGLDFNFMKAVAKIESGLDPRQRTGSYDGLFQLSHSEFSHWGGGNIFNPWDNAVAAAVKFKAELAQLRTQDLADLYLVHQQGEAGAAEHLAHPERLAWQSMCATSEGRDKGASWCKRAIWGNTLPEYKKKWRSVENVTSAEFVEMWRTHVHDVDAEVTAKCSCPLKSQVLTPLIKSDEKSALWMWEA